MKWYGGGGLVSPSVCHTWVVIALAASFFIRFFTETSHRCLKPTYLGLVRVSGSGFEPPLVKIEHRRHRSTGLISRLILMKLHVFRTNIPRSPRTTFSVLGSRSWPPLLNMGNKPLKADIHDWWNFTQVLRTKIPRNSAFQGSALKVMSPHPCHLGPTSVRSRLWIWPLWPWRFLHSRVSDKSRARGRIAHDAFWPLVNSTACQGDLLLQISDV